MDERKRWGGAGGGGRREERRYGDLVVRHKVLGVGPKHRFVLQDAETQHKNKEDGERKRDRQKKK